MPTRNETLGDIKSPSARGSSTTYTASLKGLVKLLDKINKSVEKLDQSENQRQKETIKTYKEFTSNLKNLSGLFDGVTKSVQSYVDSLESVAYHLSGSDRTQRDLTKTLTKALGGNGIVSMQSTYNNLASLVKQGITFNVEQRAFLKTVADDISSSFNSYVSTLNNLTKLYGEDVTGRGLAIEASMKEYLNQSFKNSEYLVNSFSAVVNSLYEAQSWMSASNAMGLNATVQKWLGSFESVGGSTGTVSNIANALGLLGSGNISSLSGSSMQNLLLMGANRAGLSYSDLLINGLNANNANQLMSGVMSFMASLGDGNAVVRSEYARIFGLQVSDIRAAGDAALKEASVVSTEISTNIYDTLLGKLSDYLPGTKALDNFVENILFTGAMNLGNNQVLYGTYKAAGAVSNLINSFGLSSNIVGAGINTAAAIAQLGSLIAGTTYDGSGFSLSNIPKFFEDLFSNTSVFGNAIKAYDLLGNAYTSGTSSSSSYMYGGTDSGLTSETGSTSGKTMSQIISEMPEEKTITDVIAAINELAGQNFASTVKINSEGNSVKIVDGERNSLERYTMTSAIYTVNIYELLKAAFSGGTINSVNTVTYGLDEYISGLQSETKVLI